MNEKLWSIISASFVPGLVANAKNPILRSGKSELRALKCDNNTYIKLVLNNVTYIKLVLNNVTSSEPYKSRSARQRELSPGISYFTN